MLFRSLADIAQLFVESHIEDVGDIIDDIRLLFEADTSSSAAVIDSCTSPLQGTHGVDFLPDISVLFLESHTVDMGNFHDDFSLLFAENDSTTVLAISLTFEKTDGVLTHALEMPVIIEIPSPFRGHFSPIILQLFLPKGRNIIQRSWISFFIGAFFTAWQTTFRGGGLSCLLLLLFRGDFFLIGGLVFLLSFLYVHGCMS